MRRFSTLTVCVIVLMSLIWAASPAASVQAASGAISAGCAYVNQNGALNFNHSTVNTNGLTFNAGEVITISITSGDGFNLFIYNLNTKGYEAGDEITPLPHGSVLTWTVPTTGSWKLIMGIGNHNERPPLFSGTITCTVVNAINGTVPEFFRTITVWGPVGIRAVSWQFEDSSGNWWWVYQADNSTRVQTPIEFRDRVRDGQVIPHYAMSRLTTTSTVSQNDPKTYRAFNADTLAPLHQVWIEIGSEADPNRLSVFIP